MKKLAMISGLALAVAASTICFNVIAANGNSFDAKQKKDIERIVHDYLVNQPEVLIEASSALQQKQRQEANQKAKTAIAMNAKDLLQSKNSPVIGNSSAPVTVVEFLDYQCGHCKTMSPVINELVKTNPNVRVVLKSLPIFGNSSNFASQASIAAFLIDPAKFQNFHSKLLSENKGLSKETVLKLAEESSYDVKQLETFMDKPEVKDRIKANFKLAQSLGLQGTPAFIISNNNGSKSEFIPGATTKMKLESAIKTVQ